MVFHDNGKFYVDKRGCVVVYTDGCCFFNGQSNARGGFGVYFGPKKSNNISAAMWGFKQSNNRAEILAAYFALKTIYNAGYRRAEVRTDSRFLIDCITKFMPNWKRNNWITCRGHEVINRRELEMLDYYHSLMKVTYTFVQRDSHPWNRAADSLAKAGAGEHYRKDSGYYN